MFAICAGVSSCWGVAVGICGVSHLCGGMSVLRGPEVTWGVCGCVCSGYQV